MIGARQTRQSDRCDSLVDVGRLVESNDEAAAALELNTFVEAVEQGRDTERKNNAGDHISNLAVLDKFESGVLEYATGNAGEVFQVTVLAW
jgi:hypothetical protein